MSDPQPPGTEGSEDQDVELEGLTVHERYSRVPGRTLESRFRYWYHSAPGAVSTLAFAAVVAAGWGLGFLAMIGTFLVAKWMRGRVLRPYLALGTHEASDAERVALEAASAEQPGPVADAYLTAAAAARAVQGDAPGAKELLGRRQAAVGDLPLVAPYLEPVAAAAFASLGERERAVELLGPLDPSRDSLEHLSLGAGLLMHARRYRAAQAALMGILGRTTSPSRRRPIHWMVLELARETWDPELEKLLKDLTPEDPGEAALHLAARAHLAELEGRPSDALALLAKSEAGGDTRGGGESPEARAWRQELRSIQLGAWEADGGETRAAFLRAREREFTLPAPDRADGEARYRDAWLALHLALTEGEPQEAVTPELPEELLASGGGVLWASRVLTYSGPLGDTAQAARELIAARRVAREAPAVLAAAAALRVAQGRALDEDGSFALARARRAKRLFPPEVARWLDGLG